MKTIITLFASFLMLSASGSGVAQVKFFQYKGYMLPIISSAAQPEVSLKLTTGSMMLRGHEIAAGILSWNRPNNVDVYKLEIRHEITSQWILINSTTSTAYIGYDLPLGQRYYRVRACRQGVCDEISPTVSLTILLNPDQDVDGILDLNDKCLGTPEGATVSAAGCIPSDFDLDLDGEIDDLDLDGVSDDLDYCVNATSTAINTVGCTLNQIDSDSDGVADYQDSYPYQHNSQCTQ